MKLTCSTCNTNPRASPASNRCLSCERQYRTDHLQTCRATAARYWKRNKAQAARRAEDRVTWFMGLTGDALSNVTKFYHDQQRPLPRAYHTAMNRLERIRVQKQIAHLNTLSPKLARAAINWRKANERGSRPADGLRVRGWS